MAQTFYLDEFQDKSVTFSIGKGYQPFKLYYNEEYLGEITGGIAGVKRGAEFNTSDGNTIYVQLRNKNKNYIHIEFNGIPIPSSDFYPAKVIKRASNWSMAFGILTLVFGAILLGVEPLIRSHFVGYILPAIGVILIACYFGIRRYYSIALWIPLILFVLNVISAFTEYGTFNFGTILQILAVIALIKAVKPMQQMQEIKKRLKAKESEHLIDNFLS